MSGCCPTIAENTRLITFPLESRPSHGAIRQIGGGRGEESNSKTQKSWPSLSKVTGNGYSVLASKLNFIPSLPYPSNSLGRFAKCLSDQNGRREPTEATKQNLDPGFSQRDAYGAEFSPEPLRRSMSGSGSEAGLNFSISVCGSPLARGVRGACLPTGRYKQKLKNLTSREKP